MKPPPPKLRPELELEELRLGENVDEEDEDGRLNEEPMLREGCVDSLLGVSLTVVRVLLCRVVNPLFSLILKALSCVCFC